MKSPSKHIYYIILTLYSLSCNKSNNNSSTQNKTTLGAQFYYSRYNNYTALNNNIGLSAIGDTLYFTGYIGIVNAGYYYLIPDSNYTCLWNFGDGNTSIDTPTYFSLYKSSIVQPVHIYTSTGTYTIQMKADTLNAKPINITICIDPLYTHQICQSRLWHGGKQIVVHSDTVINNLPDSTFSILYLDKVDISFWNSSALVYSTNLSTGNILIFNRPTPPANSSILWYNSLTDSISMVWCHTDYIYANSKNNIVQD